MEFLLSFLRRHFAGKPVVALRMSAVFSGYEPNSLNCELRAFIRYMVLSLWLIGNCKAAKENENKINENCETAIKANDIRKLQNLTFKKGKLVEELANYHFQGNATFLRVDQHSHNRKPREIC